MQDKLVASTLSESEVRQQVSEEYMLDWHEKKSRAHYFAQARYDSMGVALRTSLLVHMLAGAM